MGYSVKKLYKQLDKSIREEKIRKNNPFVYLSTLERQTAEKDAKKLLAGDKHAIAYFREKGTIYPEYTDMNPFHMHTQIPESETNYVHNWKMKLHDLLFYRARFKRCPIGGLIMEQGTYFDRKTKEVSKKWYVARIQPEISGLQTFKEGEHWEEHHYRFTKEYHPQSLSLFWRNDLPDGHFIDEYGICNMTKKKIDEALEHETYVRKFYYYLNFWEQWGFRYDEFSIYNRDFEVNHAKKAERYLEKCLKERKSQPFPYYDKSKDEYWKYRTPNTLELVLADRVAESERERAIYYKKLSAFTDAPPFEHSTDLIETLAGDDWKSPQTLNRILSTFPDLNKQIISPDAPEFKKRMQLVDEIIRIHPDYAPGHEGYDMEYYKAHPNSGIQEWAWRLGALMNAFGPKDPMDAQTITTLLSLYINRNAIDEIIGRDGRFVDPYPGMKEDPYPTEEQHFFWLLMKLNEFDKECSVKNASLTWYDVQFAAIYSLLHCDNVQAFYGSQFAVKTSSIIYASAEDRDRYLKVMELNHKALYDDETPLFSRRDNVRLSNLKQIQESFLDFKDSTVIHDVERENELFTQNFIFWNPLTVSYKTVLPPQKQHIDDMTEYEQEAVGHSDTTVIEKHKIQSTYNYIEVSFETRQGSFQQIGGYHQLSNRCFDLHRYSDQSEKGYGFEFRSHFYLSHSNAYVASPKYFDLAAATRPENNNSITVVFHDGSTFDLSGTDWQNRAVLTIDFNDYGNAAIESPVEQNGAFHEQMIPNANMKDIFAWIPELKARYIDFSITDTGLLTLYENSGNTSTNNTNLVEFLERNPQILIDHYFTIPQAYGLEQSYGAPDSEYPGLTCLFPPRHVENASYKALKSIGSTRSVDSLKNGVSRIDPAFLELFDDYSYHNRPTMNGIRSVQQLVLKHLEDAKHYNIFLEPKPEPIFPTHDKILYGKELPEPGPKQNPKSTPVSVITYGNLEIEITPDDDIEAER